MVKIGFIGQGYIGKNYADDFERRGYTVVRYAVEPEYSMNKDAIKDCDMVFIAVPTPTTPAGFDDSIVRSVVKLVGKGKIAVVKSTIVPGTIASIQAENPDIFVFHSPEFLTKKTAAEDAAHPRRNIIGIPKETPEFRAAAQAVIDVLPAAPFSSIVSAEEAEMIKYASNAFYYTKVVFMNLLYDINQKMGGDWQHIRDAMAADPWIGNWHLEPVHKTGRGAGGFCLIKDFAAFRMTYEKLIGESRGAELLRKIEDTNLELLLASNKDVEALTSTYGNEVINHYTKNK